MACKSLSKVHLTLENINLPTSCNEQTRSKRRFHAHINEYVLFYWELLKVCSIAHHSSTYPLSRYLFSISYILRKYSVLNKIFVFMLLTYFCILWNVKLCKILVVYFHNDYIYAYIRHLDYEGKLALGRLSQRHFFKQTK